MVRLLSDVEIRCDSLCTHGNLRSPISNFRAPRILPLLSFRDRSIFTNSLALQSVSILPPSLSLVSMSISYFILPLSCLHVQFLFYLDKYNDLRNSLGRSTGPHTACLRFLCKQLLHLLCGVSMSYVRKKRVIRLLVMLQYLDI
jgi:hypothetical protein